MAARDVRSIRLAVALENVHNLVFNAHVSVVVGTAFGFCTEAIKVWWFGSWGIRVLLAAFIRALPVVFPVRVRPPTAFHVCSAVRITHAVIASVCESVTVCITAKLRLCTAIPLSILKHAAFLRNDALEESSILTEVRSTTYFHRLGRVDLVPVIATTILMAWDTMRIDVIEECVRIRGCNTLVGTPSPISWTTFGL